MVIQHIAGVRLSCAVDGGQLLTLHTASFVLHAAGFMILGSRFMIHDSRFTIHDSSRCMVHDSCVVNRDS